MEQDKPGHAEYSSEKTPDNSDPEGRTHQTTPGEDESPVDDAFIIPEKRLEKDNLRRRLIATARSLKKKKQRLNAAQDMLKRRWKKVLDTEEKYGEDRHTKSYPKRKLLPEFDNEALEPIPPKNTTTDQPDQPPHGHDRAATGAAHKPAHDLRELLDKKAGANRSIYGSRGRVPAQDYGHQNHNDKIPVRNQTQTQQPSTACHNMSKYRGVAHPLCFTNEMLDHEFPQGFKPVNIEAYDGTTDPGVWIEDFILHIHMARGDDLHAIKYLPLKLKGPARHWLKSLP